MLLRDGGLPAEMDVYTARGIILTMLVLSLLDCMSNNEARGDLNPLTELINQPQQAANHFLPTMVDDQYELLAEQIRRALQNPNENPVAYGELHYVLCHLPALLIVLAASEHWGILFHCSAKEKFYSIGCSATVCYQ